MPKKFIKSSVRVKADPAYYQRIVSSLSDKRAAMFARAEELEAANPDDREARELRRQIDMKLSPKILWAVRMHPVASRMKDTADDAARAAGSLPPRGFTLVGGRPMPD